MSRSLGFFIKSRPDGAQLVSSDSRPPFVAANSADRKCYSLTPTQEAAACKLTRSHSKTHTILRIGKVFRANDTALPG